MGNETENKPPVPSATPPAGGPKVQKKGMKAATTGTWGFNGLASGDVDPLQISEDVSGKCDTEILWNKDGRGIEIGTAKGQYERKIECYAGTTVPGPSALESVEGQIGTEVVTENSTKRGVGKWATFTKTLQGVPGPAAGA